MKTFTRDENGNFVMEITVEDTDRVGAVMGDVKVIVVKLSGSYAFVAGLSPDFFDPQSTYANVLDAGAPTIADLLSQTPPDAEFVEFDGLSVGTGTTEDIKKERLNWLSD